MARFFAVNRDLFSTKTVSEITSEVYWVGDADSIGISVRGSTSTTTVHASLERGDTAAITDASWSLLTVVADDPGPDQIDIAPYAGWIRAQRSETTAFILALRNRA